MLCIKTHKTLTYYSFLVVAFLLFFTSFLLSDSCSAVSDYSFTYNSSNQNLTTVMCDNTTQIKCSDYGYLKVTTNFTNHDYTSNVNTAPVWAIEATMRYDPWNSDITVQYNQGLGLSKEIIYKLDSNPNKIRVWKSGTPPMDGWEITFTMTEEVGSGITPSGSLSITENGTYDVTNYAEAVVDVPDSSSGGSDYHDDLQGLKVAIYTCGGVILVVYFFYCIYRVVIRSTGGWR